VKLGALGPYLEIWGPKLDEELATALSIDDESRQKLFSGNACRILGLSRP
jgi:hypothetical protein